MTYALRKRMPDSATPETADASDLPPTLHAATGAAESQTLSPELAEIVAAWPTLPDHIRAAIRALVAVTK